MNSANIKYFLFMVFFIASQNSFAVGDPDPAKENQAGIGDGLIACQDQKLLSGTTHAKKMPLPAKMTFDGQFKIKPDGLCSERIFTSLPKDHPMGSLPIYYECDVCAESRVPKDQMLVISGEKILETSVVDPQNPRAVIFQFSTKAHGKMNFTCRASGLDPYKNADGGALNSYCSEISKLAKKGRSSPPKPVNLRHKEIREVEANNHTSRKLKQPPQTQVQ